MIDSNFGCGAFGKTVLLKDPFIDELFVAKKYEPLTCVPRERFYKNFLDEIKILYKLNHRNIVRIYNYYAYEPNCTGYILMEYINGRTIDEFVENYVEPFEETNFDSVFNQLIDAFCYIESQAIIHRDIRESNIMIDNNGTIKVIDFGIGKIFEEGIETPDSLMGNNINRLNSDTLPLEYSNGTYTSLTDMFYLAELLNRLFSNSDFKTSFSYYHILEKMMKKRPENRFGSFSEIRTAINSHDFVNMRISDEDKRIYLCFTDSLRDSIISYSEAPKFCTDYKEFELNLKKALDLNIFEDKVQNNKNMIDCIVLCKYLVDVETCISCEVATKFYHWFKVSTEQTKILILNNIINKLSNIPVNFDFELPF